MLIPLTYKVSTEKRKLIEENIRIDIDTKIDELFTLNSKEFEDIMPLIATKSIEEMKLGGSQNIISFRIP